MKIKKVSQSAGIIAEIEQNLESNSEVNAPSVKAVKTLSRKSLPQGTNIDEVKESGIYQIFNPTGTLPKGYTSGSGNVFIQSITNSSEEYGRQILHDVTSNKSFSRNLDNSVWKDWIPFFKNYTGEEQVIGTWIDGKPLYRRIIEYVTPSSAIFVEVFTLEAFLDVKRFYGTFYYKGHTYHKYPLPYGEGEYFNNVAIQDNKIMATQNGFDKSPCTLIIEYTKTTD